MAKNVKLVNCIGISPVSIFEERSKDSSTDKFANDDGICPFSLLWEKLSTQRNFNVPSTFGIFP